MKKSIEVVAAAIKNSQGQIFICKRSSEMILPNFWEFPGGKIENNETHQEALIREIREELSCDINIGKHINSSTYEYDTFIITLHVYYSTLKKGNPVIAEHSECVWEFPNNFYSYNFAPADIECINFLATNIHLH